MHNQVPRRSTARLRSIDSSGISAVSRLLSALDISADHHHFRARSDESVGRGEADTVGFDVSPVGGTRSLMRAGSSDFCAVAAYANPIAIKIVAMANVALVFMSQFPFKNS